MNRRRGIAGLIWLTLLNGAFGAFEAHATQEIPHDENSDLSLIPPQLGASEKEYPGVSASEYSTNLRGRIYLENVLTGWSNRSSLLVPTPISQPTLQNRFSLDLNTLWQPSDTLKLTFSDRLNGFAGDTISFASQANVRNDFREAYLSYEIFPRSFLEAGRMNLKSGVALGYNPTDYFKTRTQVNLASIDPSALRENRLGALMVKLQKIWDRGSFTLAYAPKTQPSSPLLLTSPPSLDPLFGQTNGDNRFIATVSYDLEQLNPQALVYVDSIGTHLGLSISRGVGNSFVFYGEWSGVQEGNITSRAIAFGQSTASLPSTAPQIPQSDASQSFQSDAVIGASWTSSFKLTANIEYHFHQAGFNATDFSQWINIGQSSASAAAELWYVRQFASDQLEPLMQHQIFVRLDWPDEWIKNLTLGSVAFISPLDGSILAQISGQYFLSKHWTLGAYLAMSIGTANTVQGSIPWLGNGVIQVVRYF